jgi:hypothetical protein
MSEEKKGMVRFTYAIDHGGSKKDDVVKMHSTTAKALEAHKIGKASAILKEKVEMPKK